ncbi:MAG: FxDxF family PEP-CTERM protein [Pseudomonadota bacterium]
MKAFSQALALVAMLAAGSAQANLIVNGDFEANKANVVAGDYLMYPGGSSAITGWTVGGTSVDLVNESYNSIGNTVSVDMLGTPGPGSISQNFAVSAGSWYTLTFDQSRNVYAANGVGVDVSFGSATGHWDSLLGVNNVESHTLSFQATETGMATLSFMSTTVPGENYSGALIDNVVVAVPEPETYGMLLAGLGLVAFMARRKQ